MEALIKTTVKQNLKAQVRCKNEKLAPAKMERIIERHYVCEITEESDIEKIITSFDYTICNTMIVQDEEIIREKITVPDRCKIGEVFEMNEIMLVDEKIIGEELVKIDGIFVYNGKDEINDEF